MPQAKLSRAPGFYATPPAEAWRIRAAGLVVLAAGCLAVACLAGAGCGPREKISTYTVPKSETPPAQTQRMLAAMVPHEGQAWFFKVTGPEEAVEGVKDAFRELVRSVRFDPAGGGRPAWDLPADWSQQEAGGMRFATIAIPTAEGALELTVIPLPMTEGDSVSYRLSNVNRWRNQLSLPPITEDQLDEATEQIALESGTATFVDLVGESTGGPPFAAMADQPPIRRADPEDTGSGAGESGKGPAELLTYDAPDGWEPGRVGGLRKAAFTVEEGGKQVEITVIDLAAAAGDVTSNVNRWRGQVGLPDLPEAELAKQLEAITVSGHPGTYSESKGTAETVLGAIVEHGDRAWFFKLKGDAELAAREQDRFRQFLNSVRFAAE